ncbi:hypothetical protein GCM10008944_27330 [Cytobacillus oceanisediminis]
MDVRILEAGSHPREPVGAPALLVREQGRCHRPLPGDEAFGAGLTLGPPSLREGFCRKDVTESYISHVEDPPQLEKARRPSARVHEW